MNKQREIIVTVTYNDLGIIVDTKAEERKKGKWIPENRTMDAFWVCSAGEDWQIVYLVN